MITTTDAYLGGRVRITQPAHGYRAGVDAVLLAAAVKARAGDKVLDLGCGVGTAALCLGARVRGLHLVGVEIQAPLVALALGNATANGQSMQVHHADIAALPAGLPPCAFDHILVNPPWFDRRCGRASPYHPREQAMGETTPLAAWVQVAAKHLRARGWATFIIQAARLPALLPPLQCHLGSLELLPLLPRPGRDCNLILLRGRKQGRAPFRLCAPIVMHKGRHHRAEGDDYTAPLGAVLRDAAALPFAGQQTMANQGRPRHSPP